jgi:SAM-dependent methyltransferase
MTWFEKWFDSPYYHMLYKNRDKKEAKVFIDNLIAHLQIPIGSKLLDVACGKGRHSVYFNKKGLDVIGIDLSINSIKDAKKDENSSLYFQEHDMRKVFRNNYFDIVTNLFTSIGYFEKDEDEQNTINSMALNLKQEGILIIDFMNIKKVIKNLVRYEVKKIDGITFNISRSVINNYIIKDIVFSDNTKHYKFKEKVKALTLTNFAKFIKNADLKIINIFGNYKLEDFDATNSERLIIICKK